MTEVRAKRGRHPEGLMTEVRAKRGRRPEGLMTEVRAKRGRRPEGLMTEVPQEAEVPVFSFHPYAVDMREVFFLIGEDGAVLWSDASDSPVRLPDSRARWEAIWERRAKIAEIVHSHPAGPLAFSREDETTMRALVTALGRPIVFSVVAPRGTVRRNVPLGDGERSPDELVTDAREEPWWAALLRLASGMERLPAVAAPEKRGPKRTSRTQTPKEE
jgi:proteasome lid subunit RPN8/RPN11